MKTLTARWIFPVDQPPLAQGTITLDGERIVAVERAGVRSADRDLGNVAILPGFVNAHTHLDLSDAAGTCPPTSDFTAWLRAVIAHRRRQNPEDVSNAIDMGLSQCLRYGTTLVGDISAGGMSWDRLAKAPLRAVVFYEMLGLSQERARAALAQAQAWLSTRKPTEILHPGLSPHAPYSVRRDLFARGASLANQFEAPLAVHLAETREEEELLQHQRGPFVEFLRDLGVWEPEGLADNAVAVMKACNSFMPKLFIHGNYLPPSVRIPRRSSIVYCPRTHRRFGHVKHPFRAFLGRNIPISLGTDSLASNPDLNVLEEARFVRQEHPDLSARLLLHMATLGGAESLDRQRETGSLTPGKSADLVVLPLPNEERADPHHLVLESSLAVKAVMFQGGVTYAADDMLS